MNNNKLVEEVLKDYKIICFRIKYLEKLKSSSFKKKHDKQFSACRYHDCDMLIKSANKQLSIVENLINDIDLLNDELGKLKYVVELVDDSLKLLSAIDERYHKVLEKHYIHSVRIEDVADIMHISRSRCYELNRIALNELATIMFTGNLLSCEVREEKI